MLVQLIQNFPFFIATRNFITMFTRNRHPILFVAKWIKIKLPSPMSYIHFNIILPLKIVSEYFSSVLVFQWNVSISDMSYTCHCFRPSRPPFFDYDNNIEFVQMMTFIPVQITSTVTELWFKGKIFDIFVLYSVSFPSVLVSCVSLVFLSLT